MTKLSHLMQYATQSASVNLSNNHQADVNREDLQTVTWEGQTASLISSSDSCQQAAVPTRDGDHSHAKE